MLVSIALALLKTVGYAVTGSATLLAAAVDSATDAFVSGVSAWSVRLAVSPPDAGHPFGHGKVEHLSALFQTLILAGAAALCILAPVTNHDIGAPLRQPGIGLSIAAVSITVAFLLARHLSRAGNRSDSPALRADAAHYASDYLTNAGVIVAFACDSLLGWRWADPVIAGIIGIAIVRLAWKNGFEAINGLMDAKISGEELKRIEDVVLARRPAVHGFHDLMTRRAGPRRFIQMHLELDASLSFRAAHRMVEEVGAAIEQTIPGALVTIHADPYPEQPEDFEAPHAVAATTDAR